MTAPLVALSRGSISDLPDLEQLWISVHQRHAEAMPELGPYVSDASSWRVRFDLYQELLGKPDTVLLLARTGEELVGYGLAHVVAAPQTWLGDTWETGSRLGEIESLAVSPGQRGQGIGSMLLEALRSELANGGVHDLFLGALSGNDAALRFYERHGYRPTWLYLSRLSGR